MQLPNKITFSIKQIGSILIVFVCVAGGLIFYYQKYRDVNQQLADPSGAPNAQVASLTAKIAKNLILPTGEQPTIATITDSSKLKDQPFFINAKVGDKVVVYNQARKTILYRPSTGKIIEVAHLGVTP